MKLRNKKTNEISECITKDIAGDNRIFIVEQRIGTKHAYNSLAELNEDWEDYEEPEEWWSINWLGGVDNIVNLDGCRNNMSKQMREIGNYFETEEDAEKAVEKLKAWKRLKDKGFKIRSLNITMEIDDEIEKDLDLLFGGEE